MYSIGLLNLENQNWTGKTVFVLFSKVMEGDTKLPRTVFGSNELQYKVLAIFTCFKWLVVRRTTSKADLGHPTRKPGYVWGSEVKFKSSSITTIFERIRYLKEIHSRAILGKLQ